MLKKTLLSVALLLASIGAPPAWCSEVPMLLNYQGTLKDPSGTPKNGTFSMQFAVYDAESGGNQLPSGTPWSETQNVTVTHGVFNVLLGSVTALPSTLFQGGPADSAGPLRYLEASVDGETLMPRRRIASIPYSVTATNTAGLRMASGTEEGGGTVTTGFRPTLITVFLTMHSGSSWEGSSFGSAWGNPIVQSSVYQLNPDGRVGSAGASPGNAAEIPGFSTVTITGITETGFTYGFTLQGSGAFHWVAYGQ